MPSLNDILASVNTAQSQTRQANEDRYGELLRLANQQRTLGRKRLGEASGVFHNRVGEVDTLLQNSGTSASTQARRTGAEDRAQAEQDLMSRGLYNTTTLDADRRRNTEDTTRSLEQIRESTDSRRASAHLQTTGDLGNYLLNQVGAGMSLTNNLMGVIERRTDEYPDLSAYAGLVEQTNAANAQQGHSYSSGNLSGGGGGGGGGSSGGGSREQSPSSYSSGGGGGGGGGGGYSGYSSSGLSTRGSGSIDSGSRNSIGANPQIILPGSTMYLGGRALGPNGQLQGVNNPQGDSFNQAAARLNPGSMIRVNNPDGSFSQAGGDMPDQQATPMEDTNGPFASIGAAQPNTPAADAGAGGGGSAPGGLRYYAYGQAPPGARMSSVDANGRPYNSMFLGGAYYEAA